MPFGIGIAEIVLVLMVLGIGIGVVTGTALLIRRLVRGQVRGSSNQELEARIRDLEYQVEEQRRENRLPRG